MMRALIRFLVFCIAVVGLALPASAADGSSSSSSFLVAPRRAHHPPIGIRAYAIVDVDVLAATHSYNAVVGSSHVAAFGAGADIVDVWKRAFVRVAVTHASKSGTRGFVDNGQFFSLQIPGTITWTPIEVGGGWRFGSARRATSSITPYVGAAFVALGYKETWQFAQSGDNVSTYLPGAEGFGGVEFGILKHVSAAAEAQYRTVPSALGADGVSKDFNEKDAGGFTARVLIGYRW